MFCCICEKPIVFKPWYKYNGLPKTCGIICKNKLISLSNLGRKVQDTSRMKGSRFGKPAWNKGRSKYPEYNYIPYFCDCGCMEICNNGKRFVSGHNFQGKNINSNPWKTYKNRHKSGNPGAEKSKKLWLTNTEWRKQQIFKILQASHKRPNYKEDYLLKNFLGSSYRYVGNGEVTFGRRNPDFINTNGEKKLVEFFGANWHKPEDEKDRIDHYKKYGFDCLVIWENELSSTEKLKEKISNF